MGTHPSVLSVNWQGQILSWSLYLTLVLVALSSVWVSTVFHRRLGRSWQVTAGHSCLRLAGLALLESEITWGQVNKDKSDNYLPQVKYICTTHILVNCACQSAFSVNFHKSPVRIWRGLLFFPFCIWQGDWRLVLGESFALGCTENSNWAPEQTPAAPLQQWGVPAEGWSSATHLNTKPIWVWKAVWWQNGVKPFLRFPWTFIPSTNRDQARASHQ